jgi:hypothetical protein
LPIAVRGLPKLMRKIRWDPDKGWKVRHGVSAEVGRRSKTPMEYLIALLAFGLGASLAIIVYRSLPSA